MGGERRRARLEADARCWAGFLEQCATSPSRTTAAIHVRWPRARTRGCRMGGGALRPVRGFAPPPTPKRTQLRCLQSGTLAFALQANERYRCCGPRWRRSAMGHWRHATRVNGCTCLRAGLETSERWIDRSKRRLCFAALSRGNERELPILFEFRTSLYRKKTPGREASKQAACLLGTGVAGRAGASQVKSSQVKLRGMMKPKVPLPVLYRYGTGTGQRQHAPKVATCK